MIVARNTACDGIPANDKICGFTNKIYDIAKNVVKPAITSVLTLVLFARS
jgi:hypothetical protein